MRERWEDTCLGGLWLYVAKRSYHLRLGAHEIKGSPKDKDAVWHAARAFTQARERKIAEVEEEIEWLTQLRKLVPCGNKRRRILTRERAALAELKRGWKGAA